MEINLVPQYLQQGPLTEDHLELTLSCLTAEELITVRTVCKFWRDKAESVIRKPLSIAEGARRVFCCNPRFLAEPSENFRGYLAGASTALNAEMPILNQMIIMQRIFKFCTLQSIRWGRTPGTLITVNKPLLSVPVTGEIYFPDAEVRRFDLRKQTETVEILQPFAEKYGLAALCRESALISSQEHYLCSFPYWNFLIILLDSKVLRIYDRREQYRMIGETAPIIDIKANRNERAVIADPAFDGTLLVVPCEQGILRLYTQAGAFLRTIAVDWGEEPLESRFFTKLRMRNGYIAAALSNGRIDIFKGDTLFRSFRHPNHYVSDFDLGKATVVALCYQIAIRDHNLRIADHVFPTTLKVWDLETQEGLHERTFNEGPIHLEYVEYQRLNCECANGQILVLDPFLVPEPLSIGRQIVSWISFVWNAFCDFIKWLLLCFED